jgi:hypothetical protein
MHLRSSASRTRLRDHLVVVLARPRDQIPGCGRACPVRSCSTACLRGSYFGRELDSSPRGAEGGLFKDSMCGLGRTGGHANLICRARRYAAILRPLDCCSLQSRTRLPTSMSSSRNLRTYSARLTSPSSPIVVASAMRVGSTGRPCEYILPHTLSFQTLNFPGSMGIKSVCIASTPTRHSQSTTRQPSTQCATNATSRSTLQTQRSQTMASSCTSSLTAH